MATALLVDEQIEAGKRLLKALDTANVKVTTAFWLYESESGAWRLVLAMPIVADQGTRAAYDAIRNAVRDSVLELFLRDIEVVSPTDARVSTLSRAFRVGPGIHTVRVTNNLIGDVLIEDALIYRST